MKPLALVDGLGHFEQPRGHGRPAAPQTDLCVDSTGSNAELATAAPDTTASRGSHTAKAPPPTSNSARDIRPADCVTYIMSDDSVKLLICTRDMYACAEDGSQ